MSHNKLPPNFFSCAASYTISILLPQLNMLVRAHYNDPKKGFGGPIPGRICFVCKMVVSIVFSDLIQNLKIVTISSKTQKFCKLTLTAFDL